MKADKLQVEIDRFTGARDDDTEAEASGRATLTGWRFDWPQNGLETAFASLSVDLPPSRLKTTEEGISLLSGEALEVAIREKRAQEAGWAAATPKSWRDAERRSLSTISVEMLWVSIRVLSHI